MELDCFFLEVTDIGILSVCGLSIGYSHRKSCERLQKKNIQYRKRAIQKNEGLSDIVLDLGEVELCKGVPKCCLEFVFKQQGLLSEITFKRFNSSYTDSNILYEFLKKELDSAGLHRILYDFITKDNGKRCYLTNWAQNVDLRINKDFTGGNTNNPVSLVIRPNSGDTIVSEVNSIHSLTLQKTRNISSNEVKRNYWKIVSFVLALICLFLSFYFIVFKTPAKETAINQDTNKVGEYVYIDKAFVMHTKQHCPAVYKDHSMQVVKPQKTEEIGPGRLDRICSQCVTSEQIDELKKIVGNN